MNDTKIRNIIEAAIMAANKPLSIEKIQALFDLDLQADEVRPNKDKILFLIHKLQERYKGHGIELAQVSSGFRFQVRQEFAPWVGKMWDEKPQRYSRALLETLALVAYRQPITRGEIEDIRGVSVSSQIIRTLVDREWIRIIGHRDVPGKPAMYATTRQFLDYFSLQKLEDLPPLSDIKDFDEINPELDFGNIELNQ